MPSPAFKSTSADTPAKPTDQPATPSLTVTKRDGKKESFNADKINRSIERVCYGLTDPTSKVMKVASETKLTTYDGITTEEMDIATINAALQNVSEDPEFDIIATRLLVKTVYRRVVGKYGHNPKLLEQRHRDGFITFIKDHVKSGLLDARMAKNFDLEKIADTLDLSRDELFSYAGLSGLLHRYAIKDEQQQSKETPQYFFMRVAMGLSFNEKDPVAAARRFYDKMSKLEYLAGGSTNLGSGTNEAALSNCFLLEVHDDIEHIAKSVADVLKLSKASGGLGASLTKLRASGSLLSTSNTTSSGPTPFAKIIDTAIQAIVRGGKKKGALCFYMENWHIDFPDYIDWKHNAGDDYLRMRTANTACFLSDEFMRRVKAGEDWYMFDPKETPDLNELYGQAFAKRYAAYIEQAEAGTLRVFKKVPATEQMRHILVAMQTTSHPWLTWKDPINLRALNHNTGTIHMSNLCTEICLPQDKDNIAVCNLASVNVAAHLNDDKTGFDWDRLADTVQAAARGLDNLIDINKLPIKEAQRSDQENRAVGLGMMGLSDALEQLGHPYGSEETYDLVDQLFEFISYHAINTSAELARERGSYRHFKGSGWSQGMVPMDSIARLEKDRGQELTVIKGSRRPKSEQLDWDGLRKKVKQGMRNATLMAVAPNANIGLLAGTTPGIDPRFAQVFSRNKFSGKYLDINHNLVKELKNAGVWEQVREQIIEHQGDLEGIEEIPENIKQVYKTSFSTSPYAFVEVAARAQKWVDQGLSRNMYLETRDIDETMKIYQTAWEKGVKTTYYLHMKPRHTAEQSTTKVNKAQKLGKVGFAALRSGKKVAAAPAPAQPALPTPAPEAQPALPGVPAQPVAMAADQAALRAAADAASMAANQATQAAQAAAAAAQAAVQASLTPATDAQRAIEGLQVGPVQPVQAAAAPAPVPAQAPAAPAPAVAPVVPVQPAPAQTPVPLPPAPPGLSPEQETSPRVSPNQVQPAVPESSTEPPIQSLGAAAAGGTLDKAASADQTNPACPIDPMERLQCDSCQ